MIDRNWQHEASYFWPLQISRHGCLQVGLLKKYGYADAMPGLVSLVKLELGISPHDNLTQASLQQC